MKKYIILVVSILLFLGQSSLFAEEFRWKDFVEGKRVLLKTTDSSDFVIICVEHSDTIDMATYSTSPLYGDKITEVKDQNRDNQHYSYYGGRINEGTKDEKLNNLLSGLLESGHVMLDSSRLRILNPEGSYITVVNWPVADYEDPTHGYCKSGKMFTLVLIDKAYISEVFNDIAGSRQNPTHYIENVDISEGPKLNMWLILFGVVCLLLVALTMYIFRLRKIVSNQEIRLSSVEDEDACAPEELKRDCKDKIALDESEFLKKISAVIPTCIEESLSAQFGKIEECLNKMSEGVKLSEQALMQEIKCLRDVTPMEQKDSDFKTRDISYRSNKFVLDEDAQFSFFEIYSTDGKYYYTLPEDRETRRSFLLYMTAYASCVEADCTTPNPTIAVPVRDGHLFRIGDSFEVDKNCLLRVELREG